MKRPGHFGADDQALCDPRVAAYPAELHRYLVRQLRNREDAIDLAQEAYLRYLQLPNSSVVRNPGSYLFRIAFNLISEWRMRKDRSAVTCDSELVEQHVEGAVSETPEPMRQLLSRERLEKILEQIPASYRRVLLLSKCDGMTNAQIAETMNVSPETVARYLGRAVAFARRAQWD